MCIVYQEVCFVCIPGRVNCIPGSVYCIPWSEYFIPGSVYCMPGSVYCILGSVYCIPGSVYCIPGIVYCIPGRFHTIIKLFEKSDVTQFQPEPYQCMFPSFTFSSKKKFQVRLSFYWCTKSVLLYTLYVYCHCMCIVIALTYICLKLRKRIVFKPLFFWASRINILSIKKDHLLIDILSIKIYFSYQY